MAKDSTFNIVSEIDFQEADNAVNEAIKEIHQRDDLKDSATEIELNKKDNAKKITKMIKDMNLNVSAQIMDERILVRRAKKDDLQIVIQKVKEADLDFPVQFVNYQ